MRENHFFVAIPGISRKASRFKFCVLEETRDSPWNTNLLEVKRLSLLEVRELSLLGVAGK